LLCHAAVSIPLHPSTHERSDLHAELDRLDRELETMRARLAREQGELHEARARCRALASHPRAPDRDTSADGAPDAAAQPSRRLARTSRLGSTLIGSRPLRAVSPRGSSLRAIAGGAEPARVPSARAPAPRVEWSDDPPPDAA
jgi:hypothetical protein